MKREKKPSLRTYHVPNTYKRPVPVMDGPPSGVWYALVCNINCERRAREGLESYDRGTRFMTYMPVHSVLRKMGGRRKVEQVIERPLFTRYLFVASKQAAFPFFALAKIDGVERVVKFDGRPIPIPNSIIEAIKQQDIAGAYDKSEAYPKTLADAGLVEGQQVEVRRGRLATLEAKVRALLPEGHAEVLINILGREFVQEVPLASLVRVA